MNLTPTARAITTPRPFLVAALFWSIVVLSMRSMGSLPYDLMLTRSGSVFGSPLPTLNGPYAAVSTACWGAAILAPWAALRWPIPSIALALAPLLPPNLNGADIHLKTVVIPALIGVATSALWRDRTLGWVIGVVALLPVAAFVWAPGMHVIVQANGRIEPVIGADQAAGLLPLAFLIAASLGSAEALRLTVTRHTANRAVRQRNAEADARAELARDLHDVVAHRMSLVAVRAETAPYSLDDLSPAAQAAFADIATEARGALDEMRTVLGVLDRGGRTDGGVPAPQLAPQPGADDIPTLVAAAREAGSPVELVGEVPTLDPLTGTTAYRVVQEALTNARRHAPNERADVAFTRDGESVTIRVTNAASGEPFDTGRGIAGMRERVERSGGMFHVKHDRDAVGRPLFVVEATLPTMPDGTGSPTSMTERDDDVDPGGTRSVDSPRDSSSPR